MMKFSVIIAAILLMITPLAACKRIMPVSAPPPESVSENDDTAQALEQEEQPEQLPPVVPHIAVITKGYGNRFGELIIAGAQAASQKYNAVSTFYTIAEQPDSTAQTEILRSALEQNPTAICIAMAAEDPETEKLLRSTVASGIPVIGFDTGVRSSNQGLIASIAQTDNYSAGAAAAEAMISNPMMSEKIRNAKPSSPLTIAILTGEPENSFVTSRVRGFLDKSVERISSLNQSGAQIFGTEEDAQQFAAVILTVISSPDIQDAASKLLQEDNGLKGVFCASRETAEGLLAATSGGADLDRVGGKYKELMVVGFEAGANQKNAVKNQYFYAAVAENPYRMGYTAIELAYDILQGDRVPEMTDTGHKLYTYQNMTQKDIANLLYD